MTTKRNDSATVPQHAADASSPKAFRSRGSRPETEVRYRDAVALYAQTDRTAREICEECGVSEDGFLSYLRTYRRDLLLARHGLAAAEAASAVRLRGRAGQTAAAQREKDDGTRQYEATLDDGTELSFDASGNWYEVDCKFSLLPKGIIPETIASDMRTRYPAIWRNGLP